MSLEVPISKGITIHHDTYPFISPSKFASSHKGKIVLITGASRGIGRATALAFAASGASVALLARTSSDLISLSEQIKKNYSTPVFTLTADVTKDSPSNLIAQVEAALGPIDILINNAGISRFSPLGTEKNFEMWWNVMMVNLYGPIAFIHAILPSFSKRGKGTIITVGSAAADIVIPNLSAYCTSKAALHKAIHALDDELKGKGIMSYIIHPGGVETTIGEGEHVANGEEMKQLMQSFTSFLVDKVELSADSMVAISALNDKDQNGEVGIRTWTGRYLNVEHDLEELLARREEVEKGGVGFLRVKML